MAPMSKFRSLCFTCCPEIHYNSTVPHRNWTYWSQYSDLLADINASLTVQSCALNLALSYLNSVSVAATGCKQLYETMLSDNCLLFPSSLSATLATKEHLLASPRVHGCTGNDTIVST